MKNSINKYMFLFSVPIPVLVDILLASARHMIFNCETYSISASHFSSKLGITYVFRKFFSGGGGGIFFFLPGD